MGTDLKSKLKNLARESKRAKDYRSSRGWTDYYTSGRYYEYTTRAPRYTTSYDWMSSSSPCKEQYESCNTSYDCCGSMRCRWSQCDYEYSSTDYATTTLPSVGSREKNIATKRRKEKRTKNGQITMAKSPIRWP